MPQSTNGRAVSFEMIPLPPKCTLPDSTFINFRSIFSCLGGGFVVRYLMVVSVFFVSNPTNMAVAHSGGLAADGCHNDRKNGGRHCHGGSRSSPSPVQRALGTSQTFPNCAAARAAGAAPVRAGQPVYGRHLDRDGDGVGCE